MTPEAKAGNGESEGTVSYPVGQTSDPRTNDDSKQRHESDSSL